MTIGDQLDDTLRTVTQKINQLEKIEYPGENEREMLVSFLGHKMVCWRYLLSYW